MWGTSELVWAWDKRQTVHLIIILSEHFFSSFLAHNILLVLTINFSPLDETEATLTPPRTMASRSGSSWWVSLLDRFNSTEALVTSKRLEISELVGGSTVLDLLIVELRLLFVLWRPVGNLFEAVVKSSFSAGSALLSPSLGITVTTVVEAKVVVLVAHKELIWGKKVLYIFSQKFLSFC